MGGFYLRRATCNFHAGPATRLPGAAASAAAFSPAVASTAWHLRLASAITLTLAPR